MTARELEEYRVLRETIRERSSIRVWVFVAGLAVWASLTIATAALAALPIATFLPLLILAATFEVVFSLHTAVERIGRYIQVFYESDADPGWEHRVMAYGRMFPGAATDPLFTAYFIAAAVLNFVPAVLAGAVAIEYAVVGGVHLLFVVNLVVARRRASRQRAMDLERFQKLKPLS
jgi:hypothetical protein